MHVPVKVFMDANIFTNFFSCQWCSPEIFEYGNFSTGSDVWAFGIISIFVARIKLFFKGVTLWEIFSLGIIPYTNLSNAETITYILDGYKLAIPKNCPPEIYSIMCGCWARELKDVLFHFDFFLKN
jgi:hypothetical protein